MSTETMEIVTLCEALPSAKRAEVTDFARFLLERSTGSYGFDSTNSTPRLSPPPCQSANRPPQGSLQRIHRRH